MLDGRYEIYVESRNDIQSKCDGVTECVLMVQLDFFFLLYLNVALASFYIEKR